MSKVLITISVKFTMHTPENAKVQVRLGSTMKMETDDEIAYPSVYQLGVKIFEFTSFVHTIIFHPNSVRHLADGFHHTIHREDNRNIFPPESGYKSATMVLYMTNIIEVSYTETPTYTLEKFLSDVGGNAGLILGILIIANF